MELWKGKVALVTGASAGIGRAIALALAGQGLKVAATARREQRLKELEAAYPRLIKAYPGDVTDEEALVKVFRQVEAELGPVSVLINNAGTAYHTMVEECEMKKWRTMFELNVLAVGAATREALATMKKNNIQDGYIINISSISSHGIPEGFGKHVYNGTKHALRVITEGLRQELAAQKSKIRVSTISPGVVETEIFEVGGLIDPCDLDKLPMLNADEIAKAVIYLLSTPPTTHVSQRHSSSFNIFTIKLTPSSFA